jgi:hypothetical protein
VRDVVVRLGREKTGECEMEAEASMFCGAVAYNKIHGNVMMSVQTGSKELKKARRMLLGRQTLLA